MRIVSLLPAATEIVSCLGLGENLVGISHECDYPPEITDRPQVTSSRLAASLDSAAIDSSVREQLSTQSVLFDLDVELLCDLQPDFILTQSTCSVCAVASSEVERVCQSLPRTPLVINVAPHCLATLFRTIEEVGKVLGCPQAAADVVRGLVVRVEAVQQRSEQLSVRQRPTTLLLEWLDPPFSAGHWNPELVRFAGGQNLSGEVGGLSKAIRWEEVQQLDPDLIFVACCGYNVQRTRQDVRQLRNHSVWSQLRAVHNQRVFVSDGSAYFNRPGPRLVDSLEILAHALDPEIHPIPVRLEAAEAIDSTFDD